MWLEYTIQNPYNKDAPVEILYFEARTQDEADALWQLRCAAHPRGTASSIRRVDKPSHKYCEDILQGLHIKLESIEEEIKRFEGYMNDIE